MKSTIALVLLSIAVLFTSCSDYGKNVKISDRVDVYYKGDGVAETDARKLGMFFDTSFKDATNKQSLQVTKDSGRYVVRMVVDVTKVKDNALDESFNARLYLIESQVFAGSKVKLVLTDPYFKDVKTFRGTAAGN